jgi:hypothetical protein
MSRPIRFEQAANRADLTGRSTSVGFSLPACLYFSVTPLGWIEE